MDFLDLVKKRQSDRKYKNTPVDREKIIKCLEAARLAPSACNSQPWKFVVVDDPQLLPEMASAAEVCSAKSGNCGCRVGENEFYGTYR